MPDAISPPQISANPNQKAKQDEPPKLPEIFRLTAPDEKKTLENEYHVFQTFNNCGPASLSMVFSYYGINKSQDELGRELRPYQNQQGDNDDKSVTFEELSQKQKNTALQFIHARMAT